MKNIFIDTDCGIDDATAIMIALAADNLKVLGIGAVAGNIGLNHVVNNITGILSYFGRKDIPVFKGASSSLLGSRLRAEGIHGSNGLGNVELPDNSKDVESITAPEGLLVTAKENPGMTIVALGPLTNIAISLNLYPEVKKLIKEIVIMGGSLEKGNVTQFAEFNFAADPESVHYIFESGIPLTIIPWDACVPLIHNEDDLKKLGMEDSKAGKLFLEMQKVPLDYIEKVYGFRAIGHPDPITMAYVVDESVAKRQIKSSLRMELNFNPMRGASLPCEGHEMDIILEINKNRFNSILTTIKALK